MNKSQKKIYIIEKLTPEQNNILMISINKYVDYYISDNNLSINLKQTIINDKFDDIRFNIINSSFLLNDIQSNKIDLSIIPWLEPFKLDNSMWQVYIDKINKNKETIEKMATINVFKCKKCGEKKCTSYQLQTRSIDEPMTTFINCTVCGNSWKF